MTSIRPIRAGDLDEVVRMRGALWPDGTAEHEAEVRRCLRGEPLFGAPYQSAFPRAILVAEGEGTTLCGFIEVGIRSIAEGCHEGNPVGYIEGWYVDPGARRRGVGRALVAAGEDWARGQGCTEMASDADPGNAASIGAHAALGYREVGRGVHFRKPLRG